MSWFSKVFKNTEEQPSGKAASGEHAKPTAAEKAAAQAPVIEDFEPIEEPPPPRNVVHAPRIMEAEEAGGGDDIRIKAQIDERTGETLFMVDRPLLDGMSFVCGDRDTAYGCAPLAGALFDSGGVASVTIHNTNVTVARDGAGMETDEEFAQRIGGEIRAHLKTGMPVVLPEVLNNIPSDDEIRTALQRVIDEEINPGIASHSGVITLNRVEGNTAYITMGGGCQGCAASTITLRSGIEGAFRAQVPLLGAILDETDHSAGTNPYFKTLPAGMGG